MNHQELYIGSDLPSEETALQALRDKQFDAVAQTILSDIMSYQSPRILSVARPDLTIGLAKALWPLLSEYRKDDVSTDDYKGKLFSNYASQAAEGDPAAISTLPKLANSLAQAAFSTQLLLEQSDAVHEWREDRTYVQFIGSFNPQHIGHRATIARTLEAAGPESSVITQVVENHPIKKDSLPPYRSRFDPSERKLYTSSLNTTRVTQLDVPVGLGLARKGAEQIKLIAEIVGDKPRWQVGSDKFMTDVNNVRNNEALDKAGVRFEKVHLYVTRRDSESLTTVQAGIDYVRDRFNADITLIPETTNPTILSSSASKIRKLRSEGKHLEADHLEFSDIEES